MNILIPTLILVAFYAYTEIIRHLYGRLTSVSASSYSLGDSKHFFTLTMWGIATLNLFMIYHLPDMTGFLVVASIGLYFSGATVLHAKAWHSQYHLLGTLAAIASTFIGFGAEYGTWIPAIIFAAPTAILYFTSNKWIWWTEKIAMTITCITYVILSL